jgi:hypothetical protein
MKFKYKNALYCALAILPVLCAVESYAGEWEDAYNTTQRLNDKQKLFLDNVIWYARTEETQLALCYFENGISKLADTCKTGASGAGWEFSNKKTNYISEQRVQSYNHSEKEVKEAGKSGIIISEFTTVAEPSVFGEGVTYVHECTINAKEQISCYPSKKSTCINHGLCKDGSFYLEALGRARTLEINFQ